MANISINPFEHLQSITPNLDFSSIIDGAPDSLNTLKEIADKLLKIEKEISNKANKADIPTDYISKGELYTKEEVDNKIPRNISQLNNDLSFINKNNCENYSQEEQIIGTWIDGSPIYRKVVTSLNYEFTKNQWCYIEEGIPELNIKLYINIRGVALCYSDKAIEEPKWQPIPRICPDACELYSIGFGDFSNEKIGVLFGTNYTKTSVYLVLDYIKKTDLA